MTTNPDENKAYWKFIQGFLLGQILLCVLLYFLLKYWFLDDASKKVYQNTTPSVISQKLKLELEKKRNLNQNLKKNFGNHKTSLNLGDLEVLSKVSYSLKEQEAESCNWLNVLIAQLLFKYRDDLVNSPNFFPLLQQALNTPMKPSILGAITLTDLNFGSEFPILSQVVIEHNLDGAVHAQAQFDFNDSVTFGLESSLLVSLYNYTLAALPFSLSLSLTKFSGKLSIELDLESIEPSVHLSFQPDHTLEFETSTLLGYRSKLKDPKKVADLIIYKLKSIFQQNLVYPNTKRFHLPKVDLALLNLFKKEDRKVGEAENGTKEEKVEVEKKLVQETVQQVIQQVQEA